MLYTVEQNPYVNVREVCSIGGIHMFVPVEFRSIRWGGIRGIGNKGEALS